MVNEVWLQRCICCVTVNVQPDNVAYAPTIAYFYPQQTIVKMFITIH